MRRLLLLAVALSGLLVLPVLAAQSVSIRLVHATNQSAPSTSGVEDVASVLSRTFPFNHFRVLASASQRLPANGASSLDGYSVSCSGPQGALKITVRRGGRELVNTTVGLQDGKPLVLGELPCDSGRMFLVFVAR